MAATEPGAEMLGQPLDPGHLKDRGVVSRNADDLETAVQPGSPTELRIRVSVRVFLGAEQHGTIDRRAGTRDVRSVSTHQVDAVAVETMEPAQPIEVTAFVENAGTAAPDQDLVQDDVPGAFHQIC